MKKFVVTVEIVNRYWAIEVLAEATTPELAQSYVEGMFKEAVSLHYITGEFQVAAVTPLAELS